MKVKVKSLSRVLLCDPMDDTVRGILQARILEWVAFPFSKGSSQPRSPALQVDSLPTESQGKLNGNHKGRPICRGEDKITVEIQGQCG